MTNLEIIQEYKKLLNAGRTMLKSGSASTSLEPHTIDDIDVMKQLLRMNKYVFTNYSTNEGDENYSIEFAILADCFEETVRKLKENNYFFIAKNYKTGKYDENIFPVENSNHYLLNNHNKHDFGYNNSTKNVFLEFEPMVTLFKHYIDIGLLSLNVAIFLVEDPKLHNKELYIEVTNIVKPLVSPLLMLASRTRVSNKSVKRKKYSHKSLPTKLQKSIPILNKSQSIQSIGGFSRKKKH
jgi:hypothetical protein